MFCGPGVVAHLGVKPLLFKKPLLICHKIIWGLYVILAKSDNAFPLVFAHISPFNIVAPMEYTHSTLKVAFLLGKSVKAIPSIHEINDLRQVL